MCTPSERNAEEEKCLIKEKFQRELSGQGKEKTKGNRAKFTKAHCPPLPGRPAGRRGSSCAHLGLTAGRSRHPLSEPQLHRGGARGGLLPGAGWGRQGSCKEDESHSSPLHPKRKLGRMPGAHESVGVLWTPTSPLECPLKSGSCCQSSAHTQIKQLGFSPSVCLCLSFALQKSDLREPD